MHAFTRLGTCRSLFRKPAARTGDNKAPGSHRVGGAFGGVHPAQQPLPSCTLLRPHVARSCSGRDNHISAMGQEGEGARSNQ